MKKEMRILAIFFIAVTLTLSISSASSIDSQIKKITNYAENFETGNINYIQLLIYSSAVREEINRELGTTSKEMGGILKEEQLRGILGEPTESTKWVWVESEEREIKLDEEAPGWRKIIFDGNKIQIWISSWPSMIKIAGENTLVYRLNFDINFKEKKEELNIESKISEIKELAGILSKEPSRENAEALARESVNAEQIFQMFMKQSSGKCEDTMKGIFGSENKRAGQKMLVQEVSFYEGEKIEAMARLEMCDECEWRWINLDIWLNARGRFKMQEQQEEFSPDQFKNLDSAEYKKMIQEIISEAISSLEQGNYERISYLTGKMRAVNEAWNQRANDVWPEVEKLFKRFEDFTPEEQSKLEEFWWLKQEQQKREKVKEISNKNYLERKEFYLSLFSQYDKKEFYFSQDEYEKRLIEEFREFGKEKCDNNADDNKNEKVDCADEQCLGKRCGKQKVSIQKGNETIEEERDLFCIQGSCQLKEESFEKADVCGNNICEGNETEFCKEDCMKCPVFEAVNCTGKVIFKGKDKQGCELEPICIEEKPCSADDECNFLCGQGECFEGKCRIKELSECREAECEDGEEKTQECSDDTRITTDICEERVWKETGVECVQRDETANESEEIEEGIVRGEECVAREDCGGEHDVCSNGRCISIPEVVQPEEESEIEIPEIESEENRENIPEIEQQEEQRQDETENTQPEPQVQAENQEGITGGVIFAFFRGLFEKAKITGAAITGFDVEQPNNNPSDNNNQAGNTQGNEGESSNQQIEETGNGETQQQDIQTQPQEQPQDNHEDDDREQRESQERENRERENKEIGEERRREEERRQEENKERCRKDCNRPCVEKCIRENCGEELKCNVDEEQKKCESSCSPDDSCVEKCMKGGEWWQEFEQDEHKEEKGVFKAGGMCRTAQGSQKTEAFIYFDGWGDPFRQIQPLKQKYYSGGNADWCKTELENLLKQRKELEQGLNQEFVSWFFEKYLANSADEWEQHVSGIFEIYWRDVELSKQIAERMNCLEMSEMPQYNLINVKYETDYGRLEFWEEIKTVKLPGLEQETSVISPYMKMWVFPPKQFIISEMKKAMKTHEFPGSPEEKLERGNEEGPTAEEREMIKKDKKFMSRIREISGKYGGNVDVVVRFVDNGEVVFNLYAQINENDIMKFKPMLPEEVPQEDVRVEIEFEKLYDIIYMGEKENGERIESPPWDKKERPFGKIKEAANGIKMYFKVRDMMNSAKISPESSEKDAKALMKAFFSMMMRGEGEPPQEHEKEDIGKEKGVWEEKEKITGEIIR